MARRLDKHNTPVGISRLVTNPLVWKIVLLLFLITILVIPAFLYGDRIGGNVLPTVTKFFYNLSAPFVAIPTPQPPFPTALPQAGSVLYTVQNGDSCDEILAFQMRMSRAGEIFSDVKPNTVNALDAAVGQHCHKIQPGMVVALSPQYPLTALGGVVLKIEATSPQQVLPTPLIHVSSQQPSGPDCSEGCLLTVRLTSQVQVRLLVQTGLSIHVGAWVWAQAMFPRQNILGFADYPYADTNAFLNGGMPFRACDFQVDDMHDDNSLLCSQLAPNTIRDDDGSWLLGVTGPGSLDHWRYHLSVPPNTRVLVWLSNDKGTLRFQQGNPVYKYDEGSNMYVKV